MAFAVGRKVVLVCLLLAVVRRTAGQGIIGQQLPCQDPAEDPDPSNPEDNFSCPNLDPNVLECYSTAQLCNSAVDCTGGSDEGTDLVSLDCDARVFVCTPGVNIPLTALCDGNADCANGDDETTTLCENKCLLPYYGGCDFTRLCVTSEFDVNCGDCHMGFVVNPANLGGPCLIEIGLEQTTYTGSETGQITQEICATIFVNAGAIINGIDGAFDSLARDTGMNPATIAINGQISSSDVGSADASDFQVDTLPVTISRTQPRDCVTFRVTDDAVVDPGEFFNVILVSLSGFATVRPSRESAVVTIDDNDNLVTAVYQPGSYNVNENAGTAEVCIAIVARVAGVTMLSGLSTVTPSFLTAAGTATANADYTPIATPVTLVFPAATPITTNPATSASMCFTFPIINDNLVELTETVVLGLDGSSGLIDPNTLTSQATVFIINDDDAEFSLDMSSYTVAENNGPQRVFAQIVNGAVLGTNVEVIVRTIPGTAVSPGDFTNSLVTFTFQPGNQNPMFLDIPIIDDATVEPDETFQVELSIGAGFTAFASAVDPFLSPVLITDDDAIPFAITLRSASVGEAAGFAVVDITPLVAIPGPNPITIFLSTSSGSATGGADYDSLVNEQVVFPVNSVATMTRNIAITDDRLVEDNMETFTVIGFSNDGRVTINGSPATVTIIDNDVIIYGFTQTQYSVREDQGPMTVTLQLTSNSGIPLITFTALVSTSDITADQNSDYSPLSSSAVNFPALSMPGSTQDFQVTIIDDLVPENTESFQLSTTSNDPDALVAIAAATGLITDNDPIIVGFERILYVADEEMMPGAVSVCVIVISPGVLPRDVDVTFNTEDGSALAGSDYQAVLNRIITFPTGSGGGSSMCVDVPIINDNMLEIGGEDFFATITSTDATVAPVFSRATIVLGESNDEVTCNFEQTSYLVVEDPTTVMACITCNANRLGPTIMINVNSAGGSATPGLDYTAVNQQLTFSPGNMRQCADVVIMEDPIVETDETINLVATGVSLPPGSISIGTGTSTVTIIDDDNLVVRLVPTPPVREDSGPAMVCVEVVSGSLSPGLTAVISLSTRDGTAVAPGDYTALNSAMMTFTSANDDQMLCFPVTIEDDDICEDDEIFFLDLTSDDPNVIVLPPAGSVTILDNDVATVDLTDPEPNVFMDGAYQVTECADEGFYFNVSITNDVSKGPSVSCVITVRTEDGSAMAGSDYDELDTTCVLDVSTSECEFHIGIIDDFTAENTEYLSILLESNDPTRCTITNDNITVRILDDEDCDDGVCGDFEMCEELMCPNNFTCVPTGPDIGDDPHFAVTLASGKTLCYTVQGEHGFAFNLISNKKVYMNAMFVPDAVREEVTWLGTMGIIVNSNGYKKSNMTRLRFEAIRNKIHIDDQMVLDARNIEKITIDNGKLMISEAPPTEGYKQPFVRIDLKDVELSFSIKFMTEHLDLYWHSTGQNVVDSHGLIGQFFHRDVQLDEVRKILMIPGKEPVPVQRKPVWAFMEREAGDSSNFCWVAMNPGYQGEGLIDGTYFDYLVDDVLSTEFKFKKL